jgi:3',5'-cyclic AMP phosphodiesterase CpdA
MKTIAHISDLHFGRLDEPVAKALVEDLRRLAPDLLVVSGDFTQRARAGQYARAAEYLKRLPTPRIVVPGNHDVPMYNVVRRFFFPLNRYYQYITRDLFPVYQDEQLFVLGVNTARSFTQKSGWFGKEQLEEICRRFSAAPAGVMRVLVTHHPFIPPPGNPHGNILKGAARALARLHDCRIDLMLAGHLHRAYHNDVRSHHVRVLRSTLSIQAGTATSTRRRHEANGWNWITVESPDAVTVAVRSWNGAEFQEASRTKYMRVSDQWKKKA